MSGVVNTVKKGVQKAVDLQEGTQIGRKANPAAGLRKTISGMDLQGDNIGDKAYSGLNQLHKGFVRDVDPLTEGIDWGADKLGDSMRAEVPEPPEPAEVPSREDAAERQRNATLRQQRIAGRRRSGRSGTILTGGQGLGSGGTRQRSLLGG